MTFGPSSLRVVVCLPRLFGLLVGMCEIKSYIFKTLHWEPETPGGGRREPLGNSSC
jgi:hypothetical protein